MEPLEVNPNSQEMRDAMRHQFAGDFSRDDIVLALAEDCLNEACEERRSTVKPDTKIVALSVVGQGVRQFRSIISLCEIGMAEDATILARSLFETLLAERFLLQKPRPLAGCGKDLRARRDVLGKCKPTARSADFRADLYRAKAVLSWERTGDHVSRRHGSKRLLSAKSRASMAATVADIERTIGTDWLRVLKAPPRTYSGLSVAHQAENYKLDDWYLKVYGPQSACVHASNALAGFKMDGETAPISTIGRAEKVPEPLQLSGLLLLTLLEDVDWFFQLGKGATILQASQLFRDDI